MRGAWLAWKAIAIVGLCSSPIAAATAPPNDASAAVVQVFTEACIDGGLKTKSATVEAIRYASLPDVVRAFFGVFGGGDFYRLTGSVEGYLLLGKARWSKGPEYSSVCAVVNRNVALADTAGAVVPLLFATPKIPEGRRLNWVNLDNLDGGYNLTARYLMPTFNGAGGWDGGLKGAYISEVGPGTWSSLEIRSYSADGLAKATKRTTMRR